MEEAYKNYGAIVSLKNNILDSILPNAPKCQLNSEAIVKINSDTIEVFVEYKSETGFGQKLMQWTKVSDRDLLGDVIAISPSSNRRGLIEMDVNESKITGVRVFMNPIFESPKTVKCQISIDMIKFIWLPNQDLVGSAEFYIENSGMRVLKEFYGPLWMIDEGKFEIGRMKHLKEFYNFKYGVYRPEFWFRYSGSKESIKEEIYKEPLLRIYFIHEVSEDKVRQFAEKFIKLTSFIYQEEFSFTTIRIHLQNHTIVTKYTGLINHRNLQSETVCSLVQGLKYSDILKIDWEKQTADDWMDIGKAMDLFCKSFLLRSTSEFIVRYNALEILCSRIGDGEGDFKFTIGDTSRKKLFNEIKQRIMSKIDIDDKSEFNSKWESTIKLLTRRTIKGKIRRKLISEGFDVDAFKVNLTRLVTTRNYIIHGSTSRIDEVELLELNKFLYQLLGFMLLKRIGINTDRSISMLYE